MKTIQIERFTCHIGENAKDNWNLLDQSDDNDILFHLTSFPSCYVILKDGEKIDEVILEKSAKICLQNTKYRRMKNVYVDYTPVSNAEKGEKIGELFYRSNRKVHKIKVSLQ